MGSIGLQPIGQGIVVRGVIIFSGNIMPDGNIKRNLHWVIVSAAWFLFISSAEAQEISNPDPLFQSNEILDVRIVAPMSTVIDERPIDEELPGKFQYTNSAGEVVEFDIKLRARGRFRLDKKHCRFPPLRLNFVKSQTKDTLFHKQDKVKLVTHCRNSGVYREVVLREYVAYRILNVMADTSFRVRLMRITYVDTDSKNEEGTRLGFVVETKDRLAKRLGLSVLHTPSVDAKFLNPEYANTVSLYHYLIGNTDFSSIKGGRAGTCCHNHALFGNDDEPVWSVPYDFDQAGLVNAPHAFPNPRFKLVNVKRRLYRGRCLHNDFVNATVASYQNKREEILQVLNEVLTESDKSIRQMTVYIDKFYETLDSERTVNKKITKECI
jgi:hypothetical protein